MKTKKEILQNNNFKKNCKKKLNKVFDIFINLCII